MSPSNMKLGTYAIVPAVRERGNTPGWAVFSIANTIERHEVILSFHLSADTALDRCEDLEAKLARKVKREGRPER